MKTLTNPFLPLFFLSAFFFSQVISRKDCGTSKKLSTSKLVCYYSTVDEIDSCYCTHVILPSNTDVKGIERVREKAKGVKLYVSVNEFNQGLIDLLKSSKVDGLEINLKKLDSKNDISDFISTVKSKIGTDLDIALSVPAKSELVAKYFNFKALSKHTDMFILQTAFLGASTNVTFHPSRLSGMWDMQNTDSVVDLISGLGVPLSKLVIAAPVQAFLFTLQREEYTAPGSPAVELKSVTRDELCQTMHGGKNWTLERDEDQAGPYIFRKNQWIAFEDLKSIDIKAKYSRVRGLAGIALKDLAQDGGAECGSTILEATYNGLSRQSRAPRGAVLHSLEREILESASSALDYVQVSPYTISRIIDTEGKIHINRQDTRTEFQCSRQGYFVHPRSCNRFYRCVKFDQRSNDFNVFEFDCPAGLAFDERVEVCVWPGSLSHGTPCSGSSEIAPVPRSRFECPTEPGYYADPENCRWFFACLDHGKTPLEAYEFRCPFGLGFDGKRLVCEWPWMVPSCGNLHGAGLHSEYYYGGATGNNGYDARETLSPVVVLQNYDGLGALGTIKLGGIAGAIQKPIATVYSNVGGALGLGYQNNGGSIVGGGLSYKAAQALANAGLLRVNSGAGYQTVGHHQGTIYPASDLDGSNANIQYSSGIYNAYDQQPGYTAGSEHSGEQGGAVSTQSFIQYTGQHAAGNLQASGNLQYLGVNGQLQGSNLHLVHDSLDGIGYGTTGSETYGNSLQNIGHNYNQNTNHGARQGSGLYAFAVGSSTQNQQEANGEYQNGYVRVAGGGEESVFYGIQNEGARKDIQVSGYNDGAATALGQGNGGYVALTDNYNQGDDAFINSGSYASGKADFSSQFANGGRQDQVSAHGITGGAISTQSFTQLHDQLGRTSTENYDSGVSGNINIIGGGYSAVGSLSGVQVSNNGEADDVKTVSFTSTPSPISVTTHAPISTVASVPTVTAVPVPGIKTAAGFETFKGGVIANVPELQYKVKTHDDHGLLTNISASIANFVVTTPATLTKPAVHQTYSQDGGYVYQKPARAFEEGALNAITLSTARPFLSVSTQEPTVYISSTSRPILAHEIPIVHTVPKPAVSSVTYQQYDTSGGYKYEKPLVAFQEGPQGAVVDTYSAVSTPTPAVYVSQQPQVYVSSTPAAPAVSSYSFTQDVDQRQDGYYYNKPAVRLEEGYGGAGGYYYEKPAVKLAENPIIVQQQPAISTVQLQQKNVVENYPYRQPAQPAVISQFYYQQQPVIKQPIVPLYKQPELLTTYTYQPPVQKTVYKQSVSPYTYQNIAQEAVGIYAKPQVALVQQPIQTYSYQSNEDTSYQSIKLGHNVQENSIAVQSQGYEYPRPSIAFEDKPQIGVVSTYQYSTPQPNVIIQEKSGAGYVYEKPAVHFEETPVIYSTPRPAAAVQPAVVTSYFNTGSLTSGQAVKQEKVGYSYPKSVVEFKETPVVYSTPKPPVIQPVTPAVVTSYFNIQSSTPSPNILVQEPVVYSTPKPVVVIQPKVGYTYPKPGIKFEEKPVQPVVVPNYIVSTTPQPNIIVEDEPVNYITKPQVTGGRQPAVVTRYFNQQPSKYVISKGYDYPKPAIQFVEEPQSVVTTYDNVQPVQEVPFVKKTVYVTGQYQQNNQENYNYQQNLQHTGQVVVENFVHPNYEKVKQALFEQEVYQQQPQVVLNPVSSTPKPSFGSTVKAIVTQNVQPITPASVTFYDSRYTATPVPPTAAPEIKIVSTTSRPISSYSFSSLDDQYQYQQNTGVVKTTAPEIISYDYISTTPQPSVIVEKQPIIYTSKTKTIVEQKPAVVTSFFYQQPSSSKASKGYDYPKPAVQLVEEPQSVIASYGNVEPVQEVPFVKKTAYVTGDYQKTVQENYNYQQHLQGNYQPSGKVVVENYVHPYYLQYQRPQVTVNYVQSTPKPSFVSTVNAVVTKKLQPVTPVTVVYGSQHTSTPSTVAPETNIVSTTSRPISEYSFSSLDDEYQQYDQNIDISKTAFKSARTYIPVTSRVAVTTEIPIVTTAKVTDEYLVPEITTLARDYLPARIRTKLPAREYLPAVEVTTPSSEYLPSRENIAVTTSTVAPEVTTLLREYLPVRSRVRVTTTGAPLEIVRPVTVIKQNDAHPLLSAKLGAQCTCISGSVKLRKKQKVIVVDDDDDDDGYVVDNGNEENIIENYQYEPQKVVEITPAPEVYLQSTSVAPQTYIKKRVKIRPVLKQSYLPVTEVSEIFYKKDTNLEDSVLSHHKVAQAVRTGLNLVKQAAREGAWEGIQDALSGKQLDRYGPGGVRSRSETLQGTVDCQRAGLFRHPTECNKFYACRWDCTKNRFTLHVFNCPVHLTFDNTLGACNWPSQGPACVENTLITSD